MKIALTCLAALAVATVAHGATDSLVYDSGTGNYVLTYDCGEDGGVLQTTLVPSNKIAPAIDSSFKNKGGVILYRYDVVLGAASRQPLLLFAVDPILAVSDVVNPRAHGRMSKPDADSIREYRDAVAASSPAGWEVFNETRNGKTRLGWSRALSAPDFGPGSRQNGFRFSSVHLPGVVAATFEGDAGGTWAFPCAAPAPDTEVGQNIEEVLKNNFVPRFAGAPLINVPEPFNAAAVLSALRGHLAQLEQWQLLDAALAAQIRGHIDDAIRALSVGDRVAASAALRQVRATLRKKHPNLDSETAEPAIPPTFVLRDPVAEMKKLTTDLDRKLATRVVDFDAEYVADRLDLKHGSQ